MNNLKQIKTISAALNLQQQRFCAELIKTNHQIEKRLGIIRKIISYQHDYEDINRFRLSHAVPALQQNLHAFTKKITQLIELEEKEVSKLTKIRQSIIKKIDELNKKIELMGILERRITEAKLLRDEQREQGQMDDLSALKSSEHDNE